MSDGERHNVDYLIIGGGIAGTTAAEAIRSKDGRGAVAIISKEPYELYSRVLLPKYVEGALSREQVFLRTAEGYSKRNISLFSGEEATIVDVNRKEVRTRQKAVFFYKQLLIAAGGRVKPWRLKGAAPVPVMRFQTIDDAAVLYDNLSKGRDQKVIIVGGGFITLELLNALVPRGMSDIQVLLPEDRYWEDYVDREGSTLLEQHLERKGVFLHPQEIPTMIQIAENGGTNVYTNKHTSYQADIVAVGIGLDREVEAFSGSGMEVRRGIVTNEFLETAVEDVWAAGDIAEYYHPVFERHLLVGNWNNAFLQGRVAGLNMAARHMKSDTLRSFANIPLYAIDVLGMHVAFVGDVSAAKEKNNRTYVSRFEEGIWYERFGIENGRLVSAVLINKFEDKRVIERLITERRDITSSLSYLRDSSVVLADYVS